MAWVDYYCNWEPLSRSLLSRAVSQQTAVSIAEVVVTIKTPSMTNKILMFFTYTTSGEISKVVKKTRSCNTPAKLDAILCDQYALAINAPVDFIQHTPDRVFLLTTLLISQIVRVQKIKILFTHWWHFESLQQHRLSSIAVIQFVHI